jgi:hypothetical protein
MLSMIKCPLPAQYFRNLPVGEAFYCGLSFRVFNKGINAESIASTGSIGVPIALIISAIANRIINEVRGFRNHHWYCFNAFPKRSVLEIKSSSPLGLVDVAIN